MKSVVKFIVLSSLVVGWILAVAILVNGYLPKRPDSAAFYIGQGFFIPSVILRASWVPPEKEHIRKIGAHLQWAAIGCICVWVILFAFGGYR